MQIEAIKTHAVSIGESITDILDKYVPKLNGGEVIAITSKIISICQSMVVDKKSVSSKAELVATEAEAILVEEEKGVEHSITIINNILLPSAGIDESNGDGFYILYPRNIQETAAMIWQYLRQKNAVDKLGVIITDSHVTPLRRGVTGIAIGWCGFEPLYNYIGKDDIFGYKMRVTQINNLDALAASAVFIMGEGAEQTPIAVIKNAPKLSFMDRPPTSAEEQQLKIPMEEDLFSPILRAAKWRIKGDSSAKSHF